MVQPPTGGTVPATLHLIVTVVFIVAVLGAVLIALSRWRRSGKPTALLVTGGGLICSLNEPVVDILGLCYFPPGGAWNVFEVFGRSFPLWLVLSYVLYFGTLVYLGARFLAADPSRGRVWAALGVLGVVNLVMVLPTLRIPSAGRGLHLYYGEQPWLFLDMPVAWIVINAQAAVLASVVVLRLEAFFVGARQLLLLLVPGVSYWATWIIALPHWYMINTSAPMPLKWSATALSMAIGLWFIDTMIKIGLRRHAGGVAEAPRAATPSSPRSVP